MAVEAGKNFFHLDEEGDIISSPPFDVQAISYHRSVGEDGLVVLFQEGVMMLKDLTTGLEVFHIVVEPGIRSRTITFGTTVHVPGGLKLEVLSGGGEVHVYTK